MRDISKILEPSEEFKPDLGMFEHPELKGLSMEAATRIFEGYLRAYDAAKKHASPSPETLRMIEHLNGSIEKNAAALHEHREENAREFADLKTLLSDFRKCQEEILPAFEAVKDASTFLKYTRMVGTGVVGLLMGVGTIIGAVIAFKKWILNG